MNDVRRSMNDARRASRASIAVHSRSFALASRLLSREGRDDAAVVYAWCRRADDLVDLVPAPEQARAVQRLRRELEGLFGGEAQADTLLGAFRAVVRRHHIPRVYPEELLFGMAMDAEGTTYDTYARLSTYAFRVAGTVGLMMSHVMGVRDAAALKHAAHLGMAMQLTNICRDVHEDWRRGRLYLPRELLDGAGARHLGARPRGELPVEARGAVARASRELLRRADELYASGDRGISSLSFRAAWAVRTARLVYADIGRVILARGADPFAPRAVVSPGRKIHLAWCALRQTLGQLRPGFKAAPLVGALGLDDVTSL